MKGIAHLVSTLFYIGYIPFAPGTIASLIVFLFIMSLNLSIVLYFTITLFLLIIGFISIRSSLKNFSAPDPKQIVIDEAIGVFATFFAVPRDLFLFIIGILLFRFFDMTKVLYIKKIEKLPRHFGIMADDIAAGLSVNIILQILWRLWFSI